MAQTRTSAQSGQPPMPARSGLRLVALAVACVLAAASASGCRDAREIESVGFVLGLGIDETEDGRIEVWAQVALPSAKPGEAQQQQSWIASSVGKTVWAAMRELSNRSDKVLFRAHVRTLVFGERFARGGILRALDVLARDGQFRYKSWVFVTSDPVGDVLGAEAEQSSVAALFIDNVMRNTARSSTAPRSRFLDLLTSMEQPGDQPLLARIRLEGIDDDEGAGRGRGEESGESEGAGDGEGTAGNGGDESKPEAKSKAGPKELAIGGSAAFRGDRMVGWLDEEETAMALMVCNRLTAYSFVVPMPGGAGGTVGFDVIRSYAGTLFPGGIRTDPEDLGTMDVVLRVTGTVDIREVLSEDQIMSMRSLERLEDGISRHFEAGVKRLVDASQNRLGCDIIGLGESVRRRIPVNVWEKDVAPVWHDEFRRMKIVPDIRFEVGKRGMTMQSPKAGE